MCFSLTANMSSGGGTEPVETETRTVQTPGEPCEILGVHAKPDGEICMVTVCMNCLPGNAIFERWPHLKTFVDLSHGICKYHASQFLGKISDVRRAA